MKILSGLAEAGTVGGGFVSIGNFDGVHRGHRSMLATLVRRARQFSVPAVVFTFDPHPIVLLRPEQSPPPLSTTERKLELLAECGVDCTLVYPTDRALLDLPPRQFFDEIVRGRLAARGLVEGPNFCFGHDRAGNIALLADYCSAAGLMLDVVPSVEVDGVLVSSTEIRGLVQRGEVRSAGMLLGSPYRVRGRVAEGARRGRTLGFPTANLGQIRTVLPREGVYAGRALVDGAAYAAGINVGPNPTFAEQSHKFEVHLIDFEGDLYERWLDVELIDRIRDTVAFAGLEELRRQLQSDMARVREMIGEASSGHPH